MVSTETTHLNPPTHQPRGRSPPHQDTVLSTYPLFRPDRQYAIGMKGRYVDREALSQELNKIAQTIALLTEQGVEPKAESERRQQLIEALLREAGLGAIPVRVIPHE